MTKSERDRGRLLAFSVARSEGVAKREMRVNEANRTSHEGNVRADEVHHLPVMEREVSRFLRPRSGGHYVDATVGAGGHAESLLKASAPGGTLLGIDQDDAALAIARDRLRAFAERVHLVHGSFAELDRLMNELGWENVDGVLADLGLSSMQLADASRGFAFSQEGPLDMRFCADGRPTAADLVNHLRERDLANLLFEYGEERRARAIARRIVSRRPLSSTSELRKIVASVLGPRRRGGVDPATRTFQALRIAVNDELAALESFLRRAPERLELEGRLVILSYHSLEDRAVKHAFRERARSESFPRFRVLTPKPVRAGAEEIRENRRARSAKLRALERTA